MTRRTLIQTLAAAAPSPLPARRFAGITVMPEYIQHEGIRGVLDSLARAGATAAATSPYVLEPADEKTGSREPPIDAGAGKVRLLDRPLWGRRELFVRTAPSFTPDTRLYKGLRYQPAAADGLTRRQGPLVGEFVRAARSRGLKVYLQIQAAIPPGYRVQFGGPAEDDRPRLPDGRIPPRRVANNGSLASPHIRDYTAALIRDLCRAYPEIDGIRVDWPEYPPYFLDDAFLDFGPHAGRAAARLGLPFERMRAGAARLYRVLHGGIEGAALLPSLADFPAMIELARFKALLVDELLAGFRRALTGAGGAEKELMPNAFPPPFNLASGLDYARAARHSAAIGVKLYTMHWPMMLRFWGDALVEANPGIDEAAVVRALARWFDIEDGEGPARLAAYRYPEPEEPHPVGLEAQKRKIALAQAEAGAAPVIAIAHAYGPEKDFRARLKAAYEAAEGRVWVNRYGYLTGAKLRAIAELGPSTV